MIHDLYAVWSSDGGETWGAPIPLDDLNDPAEHDHLPFVLAGLDELAIVWIRHDDTNPLPWMNPSSDLLFSTSPDGETWNEPFNITDDDADGAVDVFATMHARWDGARYIDWVTTAVSPQGNVREIPVGAHQAYPASTQVLPLEGYSPHVVALSPCLYFGATVRGSVGSQDVYGLLFTK
jgi:hypothetical protein